MKCLSGQSLWICFGNSKHSYRSRNGGTCLSPLQWEECVCETRVTRVCWTDSHLLAEEQGALGPAKDLHKRMSPCAREGRLAYSFGLCVYTHRHTKH